MDTKGGRRFLPPRNRWRVSTPQPVMNELAGRSLGGYQLEEEIGRGSMGMVYRCKQIALGREVAVKVLPRVLARDASYVARFIREAQIIAGLNHPNIVHIYDAGQQNKLLYFVMEYVEGPTFASLLHMDGTIPQHLAAEYAAQIADALDTAYKERHVIHRDIKPENLMLDRWGKIRIMDFGLARASGQQRITIAKTLVGSIYYASPEQVWGQALDNRSDIYALGVVLYEMVSGRRPFTGRSMLEVTQAITSGVVQPPGIYNPEISPELERIILKAMARDRNQRYEDAGSMAYELRELHLKPPPHPAAHESSDSNLPASARVLSTTRERVIIHLPKRPQAQRPSYFDQGEPTQPLLDESELTHTLSSDTPPSNEEQDLNGPTHPLAAGQPFFHQHIFNDQREFHTQQPSRKVSARRTFWNQLQDLFKSSSQ